MLTNHFKYSKVAIFSILGAAAQVAIQEPLQVTPQPTLEEQLIEAVGDARRQAAFELKHALSREPTRYEREQLLNRAIAAAKYNDKIHVNCKNSSAFRAVVEVGKFWGLVGHGPSTLAFSVCNVIDLQWAVKHAANLN